MADVYREDGLDLRCKVDVNEATAFEEKGNTGAPVGVGNRCRRTHWLRFRGDLRRGLQSEESCLVIGQKSTPPQDST